jgi:hypothetical protein
MFKDFLPVYYAGAHKIPTFVKPALIQGGVTCGAPTPAPGATPVPTPAPSPSLGAVPISPANPRGPTCITHGDLKIEGT